MVPESLAGWTHEAVTDLCAAGKSEGDRHDFKFGLPDATGLTKICCAFANTYGGFIILGVKDKTRKQFEIVGVEPDKELYGEFVAKVRADPDIEISLPPTISIPESDKVLYVLEIKQSPRRPHLPTYADERVFWKRQGSDCVKMTLEEIRYQMNTYEEKREKLALLLIDLHNKLRSLGDQCALASGQYNGDVYSFDIIDRVLVEAFGIIKDDISIFRALDTIKRRLMLLNAEKHKMMTILTISYQDDFKNGQIDAYRQMVRNVIPGVTLLTGQIERSLKEKFGIELPRA